MIGMVAQAVAERTGRTGAGGGRAFQLLQRERSWDARGLRLTWGLQPRGGVHSATRIPNCEAGGRRPPSLPNIRSFLFPSGYPLAFNSILSAASQPQKQGGRRARPKHGVGPHSFKCLGPAGEEQAMGGR